MASKLTLFVSPVRTPNAYRAIFFLLFLWAERGPLDFLACSSLYMLPLLLLCPAYMKAIIFCQVFTMAAFTDKICHIILTRYGSKVTPWQAPPEFHGCSRFAPLVPLLLRKYPLLYRIRYCLGTGKDLLGQ